MRHKAPNVACGCAAVQLALSDLARMLAEAYVVTKYNLTCLKAGLRQTLRRVLLAPAPCVLLHCASTVRE